MKRHLEKEKAIQAKAIQAIRDAATKDEAKKLLKLFNDSERERTWRRGGYLVDSSEVFQAFNNRMNA
jgi:hypothetical protein